MIRSRATLLYIFFLELYHSITSSSLWTTNSPRKVIAKDSIVVSSFTVHNDDWSSSIHTSRRHRRNNYNRNNNEYIHYRWIEPIILSSIIDTDQYIISTPPYRSSLLSKTDEWETFIDRMYECRNATNAKNLSPILCSADRIGITENHKIDLFWEQIKYEAETFVQQHEQQAGSQLYQGILSHASFMIAICTIISHEIATELITATTLKDLFINTLCSADVDYNDVDTIRQDLYAVSKRDPSIGTAMEAILFHKGFHALVCYRVGHRLWQANRTGLAYYIQSTVSRIYATDIHPACRMGSGIYLRVGVGVVIGETAVIGNDVCIFEGVTLGGTGKESGDRHPKVGDGVIIYDGGAILGNIHIGEGSIVSAKSIVTKALPPLAIVSGVPAKLQSFRNLYTASEYFNSDDDLQRHILDIYFDRWRKLHEVRLSNATQS